MLTLALRKNWTFVHERVFDWLPWVILWDVLGYLFVVHEAIQSQQMMSSNVYSAHRVVHNFMQGVHTNVIYVS